MKKCIFAGSFDPPTLGHLDTIAQAAAVFDEVVVAVLVNPQKQPLFTVEQKLKMLSLLCKGLKNVTFRTWQGVVAELLKEEHTPFYVRGVRNSVDFEYETAAHYASKDINPNMITLYFPADQKLLHVSSTLVRNCIHFHTPFKDYVGEDVESYIRTILKEEGKDNV